MTSIKVKFRPSATDGKEGSIYYQVIHNRAVRQIGTELRLYESEWDKRTASVRIYAEISDSRKKYLQAVAERIRWDCKCLQAVIARLERKGGNYTVDDVAGEFNSHPGGLSLFHFMQGIISQLKQLGRVRTSETYASALASFMSFRNGQDLLLCELGEDTALLYEAWLKGRGNCPNTVSFYMRILRAVYNRAVEKGLAEQKHPFKHVYTGIDKTVKRAVPLEAIRRIKGLDLTLKPHLDYARDMFLFSFYTRDMSFIDMAYLRKSDLKDGILTYRRRKTGRMLTVTLLPEAMKLIRQYMNTDPASPYLFSLIASKEGTEEAYREYQQALRYFNSQLVILKGVLGLTADLSSYTARHTWATMAYYCEIHPGVISEAMGHSSITVTETYLKPFKNKKIDEANVTVISSLRKTFLSSKFLN